MKARVHKLKCWPAMFDAVWNGTKTAELRLNDRDYQVGDAIMLFKWCPEQAQFVSSETIGARVTHIVHEGFGLKEGYVMLSFVVVTHASGLHCADYYYSDEFNAKELLRDRA